MYCKDDNRWDCRDSTIGAPSGYDQPRFSSFAANDSLDRPESLDINVGMLVFDKRCNAFPMVRIRQNRRDMARHHEGIVKALGFSNVRSPD